jgi:Na+/proline symporter
VGETLFESVSWWWLARRFKEQADCLGSISVTDYLETRVNDTIGIVRFVASLIITILYVSYLAAQVTALGKICYSFLGYRTIWGMVFGVGTVCLYCCIRGYRGIVRAGAIHGLVMILGLISLLIVACYQCKTQGVHFGEIPAPTTYFWNVWGEKGLSLGGVVSALSFMAIGLGFLGAPHLYTRFLGARSVSVIKNGIPIAIFYTIIGDACALAVGMIGRYLYPRLADGEYIVPLIAKSTDSSVAVGLFLIVGLASIMSTADALLFQVSTAWIHDVYKKLFQRGITQERFVMASRMVMILICVFALVAAYGDLRLVFWLVLFAWAGVGSAFNPLMISLQLKRPVTRYGALAGLVGGGSMAVFWNLYFSDSTGLYEMIPGFVSAFFLIKVVSIIEARKKRV